VKRTLEKGARAEGVRKELESASRGQPRTLSRLRPRRWGPATNGPRYWPGPLPWPPPKSPMKAGVPPAEQPP